jgi:hypothetical protein
VAKYTEIHNLMPANHFGCQPGCTTTDALHYVMSYIKDAWRKGEAVGALFPDIKGAFPSIPLDRLIHNIATILFDIVVVVAILTNTLGTWRIYQQSTWNMSSLTRLLAQQSM